MSTGDDSEADPDEDEAPTAVPIKRDEPSTSTSTQPVEDEYAYDSSDEEVFIVKCNFQIE